MCLALPAQIQSRDGDDGWVVLGKTRMRINLVLVPESSVGDYVLVHAGFAIQGLTEEDARETWQAVGALTEPPETEEPGA